MGNSLSYIQLGIPRAMSYYNNFPFYYGFFRALGLEIILSDKTTSTTINNGAKYLVSDTCLPVKVFAGHIINLLDKGCTTIFIPYLESTGYKINNCSKVRGLPDLIRNVIDRPFKIIDPRLDKTNGIGINEFCYNAANQLGITNRAFINKAIVHGKDTYNKFSQMAKSGIPYTNALKNALEYKYELKKAEIVKPLSIAVIGHGYNLFDERVSMNLIKKLEKMKIKVYTSLDVTIYEAKKAICEIGETQYWANELELTGVAAYFMQSGRVDGIIVLSAFGCGPDSLMSEDILYHAKEFNLPVLNLNIDEHTGEAGFITRLEAFTDMLIRKRRMEIKVCPHIKIEASQLSEKKGKRILTGISM